MTDITVKNNKNLKKYGEVGDCSFFMVGNDIYFKLPTIFGSSKQPDAINIKTTVCRDFDYSDSVQPVNKMTITVES